MHVFAEIVGAMGVKILTITIADGPRVGLPGQETVKCQDAMNLHTTSKQIGNESPLEVSYLCQPG